MVSVLVKGQKNICQNFFVVSQQVGSIFLGVISILPIVAKDLFGLSEVVRFWRNKFLIIISTGIEGIKQFGRLSIET